MTGICDYVIGQYGKKRKRKLVTDVTIVLSITGKIHESDLLQLLTSVIGCLKLKNVFNKILLCRFNMCMNEFMNCVWQYTVYLCAITPILPWIPIVTFLYNITGEVGYSEGNMNCS